MLRICFLFFGLLVAASVHSQDIKAYVQKNTVAIRSVSPADTSYDDLQALGDAIGSARIVMLGEQDHGDAPAFLAKTRIIKYLHEKKGFNVLAFESDFFGLNLGMDLQPGADSFIRRNIFPIWTYCDACQELFFQYLPATKRTAQPLRLAGFDNQMIQRYARLNLVRQLDSVLQEHQAPITRQPDYTTRILPALDSIPLYYGEGSVNIPHVLPYLTTIRTQLKEKLNEDDFWMMVADNLVAEAEQFHVFHKDPVAGGQIRDIQMAKNLQWLATKLYPREKIIVWAANGHVAKFGSTRYGSQKMGSAFTQDSSWLKQTYVVGFTSFDGRAGRLFWKEPYTVPKPAKEGFERWIDPGLAQAFVDLSAFRRQFPDAKPSFQLKGLAHQSRFSYDWTTVFDGVFYIRDMYPCKASGK